MKSFKKSLAFILSIMMLTNGMDFTMIHAEDESDGEPVSEEVVEETSTEETETPELAEGSEETVEEEQAEDDSVVSETVEEAPTVEEPVTEVEETPVEEQPQVVENTKTEYVYEDDAYKVIATLSDPNAVSDDAVLQVTPVTMESTQYNYDAYMDALNRQETETTYTDQNTDLYDVAFMLNNEEVQPAAGSVNVNFFFKTNDMDTTDVEVVHLPVADEAKAKTTADTTEISAEDIHIEEMETVQNTENEISFTADSFSVYAITGKGNHDGDPIESDIQKVDFTFPNTQYGIIANEYYQQGDTETNVFVQKYYSTSNELGASVNYSNAGGDNYIGEFISDSKPLRFKLPPNSITLGKAASDAYRSNPGWIVSASISTNTQIILDQENDVPAMIRSFASAYENVHGTVMRTGTINSLTIDLRDQEAGTYCVEFPDGAQAMEWNNFNVYINKNQHLIIRSDVEDFHAKRFKINDEQCSHWIHDSSEANDWVDTAISFYLPNAKTLYLTDDGVCGVFVAPQATMIKDTTCAGIAVVNSYGSMERKADGEWHYHNHHLPGPDSATIEVTKSVTGLPAGQTSQKEFKFTVTPKNGAPAPEKTTVSITGEGKTTFGTIPFTTAGTFTYEVKEVVPSDTGDYEYDKSVKTVTFTVEEVAGNYQVTKINGETTTSHKASVEFTNNCVKKEGKVLLYVTKNFGANGTEAMAAAKKAKAAFNFTVQQVTDETTKTPVENGISKSVSIAYGTENDQSSKLVELKNLPAGSYYFLVKETLGNVEGFKYSEQEYVVKAEVTATGTTYTTTAKVDSDTEKASVGSTANNENKAVLPFVNTYDTVNVNVTKNWDDDQNLDKARKDLTFKLLRSTDETYFEEYDTKVLQANDAATGTVSWNNLPKYAGDKTYTYKVEEVQIADYKKTAETSSYDESTKTYQFSFTNQHDIEKVTVSGTKTWKDDTESDRPASIVVKLMADGKKVAEKTVTAENGWNYSFTGLDKFNQNREEIKYTITEEPVLGYAASYHGYDIENKWNDEKTEFEFTKNWSDNNNQLKVRPSSITVIVTGRIEGVNDPVYTDQITVSGTDKTNTWKKTVNNLPKYIQGKEVSYSVDEQDVTGYDKKIDGKTITNTYAPDKTSISVQKVWDDDGNRDGVRPSEITVSLIAKVNNEVVEALSDRNIVLNDANNWFVNKSDLDKTYKGQDVVYSIEEESVSGYELEELKYDEKTHQYTLTNKHENDLTSVSVTKNWSDNNDQDGKRPASITFDLYANNSKLSDKSVTIDASNEWTYTWDNLPKNANGKAIQYTVQEVSAGDDYTESGSTIKFDKENNLFIAVITNQHKLETVSINGEKTWNDDSNRDNKRPSSIELQVSGKYTVNGEEKEVALSEAQSKVTVSAASDWKYTVSGLPKYQEGQLVQYSVAEGKVNAYVQTSNTIDVNTENTYVLNQSLENKHETEKTSVSVTKNWNDDSNSENKRPSSITLKLLADGKVYRTYELTGTGNDWHYTFADLPKYAEGQIGKLISYTVEETVVSNYTSKTEYENNAVTITNTYAPGKTSVTLMKTWNDAENADGIRPDTIDVKIVASANGVEVPSLSRTVTLKKSENWTKEVLDLDAATSDGKKVTYTVQEPSVPNGYTTSVAGSTITNQHTPETVDISGVKEWNDNDNAEGFRPASIVVNLKASVDGKELTKFNKTLTTDASKDWKYSFTGLQKNYEGKAITYTVSENEVAHYTANVSDDNTKIVNTHEDSTKEITISKTWKDKNNQDGKRPASILVDVIGKIVKNNTEKVVYNKTYTVKGSATDSSWSLKVDNLPKYKEATEITYSIQEQDIPEGYSSAVAGFAITNTYDTETRDIEIQKSWDDMNDQDGKRPETVTIQLTAMVDQKVIPSLTKTYTVTKEAGWKYTVKDLPVYHAGKKVDYSIREKDVPENYSSAVAGFTITNTYTPEKTKVSGKKVWDDANDQDGKRPASITVNLYADGTKVDSRNVTEADQWTYTFDNLDKYANGAEIVYTVDEEKVEGYEKSISGTTITNTYETEKTSVSGTKVWDDANNQDGKRPASITVNLYADGKLKASKKVTAETNWTYTFDNLDKYADGKEIKYTVDEEKVEGYEKSIVDTTITNTYTPEKTKVSGKKVWDDANDQDGKRPESITVNLYANGSLKDSTEVTAKTNWAYTFDNLDKYANGKEISYTVGETPVDLYSTKIEGTTITNSYTPDETSITATKVWDDSNNQDGIRPASVTVTLYANGAAKETVELSAKNSWNYTWSGLAKNENGQPIVYTVDEQPVAGYEKSLSGSVITNTHKPEKTSISGSKVWDDSDNQDGKRPESITVNLYANGEKKASKKVTAETNWTYTFGNLDKYADGKEIKYTVDEEPVAGYEKSIAGTVITNTHETEKTSISGSKVWDDSDNQDGKRPESITVNLYANGTKTASQVVTEASRWTFTFDNLDKYADGKEIEYTVDEEPVAGYEKSISGTTITNTYETEKTSVSGTKVWDDANNQDGKRPEFITVNLYANGTKTASQVVTEASQWTFTFANLDKYANGTEIVYTVDEEPVEGYEKSISGTVITNTHETEKTSISGSKVWDDADNQDGKRPASIRVNLYADGTKVDSRNVTEADQWAYTFDNLEKFKDGKAIVYTVDEEAVEGYETSIDGTVITNTHKPEETEVSIKKVWDDANNQDGIRTSEITAALTGTVDGMEIEELKQTHVLTSENGWTYTFKNLPAYYEGKQVVYSVSEVTEVPHYTTEINGTTITNTHQPEETYVTITKNWEDANNQDGIRPSSIHVTLTGRISTDGRDTVVYESEETIEGTEDSQWTKTFAHLPKYASGKLIVYTVNEDDVDGYTSEVMGLRLTNTHETEKTSISGSKVWDDADNQDGKRPESITVNLYADGTKVDSKSVTEADQWAYTFDDLDKYADGKEIVYTVDEDAVEGYETSIEGTVITNTHQPAVTEIPVQKVWDDADNQDGVRPEKITVQLTGTADGKTVVSETADITAADEWKHTFENLPVYYEQKEVVYTVEEIDVDENYKQNVDGYTIVNQHAPLVTERDVRKVWDDAEDQDGARPEKITVVLVGSIVVDGTETTVSEDEEVLSAENAWTYHFANLPVNKDGHPISYHVEEKEVPKYRTEINDMTIINHYATEKTELSVRKVWEDDNNQDGVRPDNVVIQLSAEVDGQEVERLARSVVLSSANNWRFTFEELPKYIDHGKEIHYSIAENEVAGYVAEITAEGNDFTVTNRHESETVDIRGTKTWNDRNNYDRIRPESITVNLHASVDGVEVAELGRTIQVTAATAWRYSWNKLPKYYDGKLIQYQITENEVSGYQTVINGYDITNTHRPTPRTPDTDDDNRRRRPVTPDTSDSSNPALWGGLAGGMIVLVGILFFFKKKREH